MSFNIRPETPGDAQAIEALTAAEALRRLRERGASGCVVLGEPEYYGRFGFRADPALILPGFPAQYFQAVGFDSSKPHGIVTYDAAFDAQA